MAAAVISGISAGVSGALELAETVVNRVPEKPLPPEEIFGTAGTIQKIVRVRSFFGIRSLTIVQVNNHEYTIGNANGLYQSKDWKVDDQIQIAKNQNWISTSKIGGQHWCRLTNITNETSAVGDYTGAVQIMNN